MPINNLSCAICEEEFDNSGAIQSTYCGHVFHKNCLDEWKLRRRSCPMCQRDFGLSNYDHKLVLNFSVEEENLEDLKVKLENINKKNDRLQLQTAEIEFKFLDLQKQFTSSEQLKIELEKKIRQQICANNNFLELQRQYTESLETIKDLKKLWHEMCENEKEGKKCPKMSFLNTCSSESGSGGISSDSYLSSKVKILEQKLKNVSSELEKEIANSTRISIEKIKLESYIETMKNNRSEPTPTTTLKDNPIASSYNVRQYADNSNSLLKYAKENLKGKGFVTFFVKNNNVFGKTHEKGRPMPIHNKMHVNTLLARHNQGTLSEDSDDKKLQNNEIDENFYQL